MATVYLAEQESFERTVALKVLNKHRAQTEQFGRRFLREAKIAAQLVHPNIVSVIDTGVIDGSYYLAMEYLPGGDLRRRIGSGLALLESLEIICAMADAIEYASSHGVIHRDIKPSNVMFREDGSVAIVDFGIARDISSDTEVTQAGTVLGTPRYMSPEQSLGDTVDLRSDLYSIGIVFYELLSGDVPFTATSAAGVGAQHLSAPVPLLPDATRVFQGIINKILEKHPDDRYQSGGELIADIDLIRKELPPDLATTILMSKPHAGLAGSFGSGNRSWSSRRRSTGATGGRSTTAVESRLSHLYSALVAAAMSGIIIGAFFLFVLREPTDIDLEAQAVKSKIGTSITASSAVTPKKDAAPIVPGEDPAVKMAKSSLEKAERALTAGSIDSADIYISLVEEMGLESDDVTNRLAQVKVNRAEVAALDAKILELEEQFELEMAAGRLYAPDTANAFLTLDQLSGFAEDSGRLSEMRKRLHGAIEKSVRRQIASRDFDETNRAIEQISKYSAHELAQRLGDELKSQRAASERQAANYEKLKNEFSDLQESFSSSRDGRGEGLALLEQIKQLRPGDKGVVAGALEIRNVEINLFEQALSRGDTAEARRALDFLTSYFPEAAFLGDLTNRLNDLEARIEIAASKKAEVEFVLANIDEGFQDNDLASYHSNQAAELIGAFDALAEARQSYPNMPGLSPLLIALKQAYTERFNAFANAKDREIAKIYAGALGTSKTDSEDVDALRRRTEGVLASIPDRRTNYPPPTF